MVRAYDGAGHFADSDPVAVLVEGNKRPFNVAYVALMIVGDRLWIGAKPSAAPGEVVLTRVHHAFADAVDEQYSR